MTQIYMLIIFLLTSCFYDAEENDSDLEQKINNLENQINNNSDNYIEGRKQTGVLTESSKETGKTYWDIDIQFHSTNAIFVYSRTNSGQMWQPVELFFVSTSYVRIIDDRPTNISGNEYLIIQFYL